MNSTYRHYTFEELARDASFRQWVLERDPAAHDAWTQWIAQNPDQRDTVTLARAFLLSLGETDTILTAGQLDAMTQQALHYESQVVRPLWPRLAFRIAASLVLLLGIGYTAWFFYSSQTTRPEEAALQRVSPTLAEKAQEEVNTGKQIRHLTLADGSTVALYPNSRLRYPKTFGVDIREVYLNGQAFFSISKDPKRPFWVYTDKISTQVLGTRFMVNAFSRQEQASVEVTEGQVSVYRLQDIEHARQHRQQALAGVILTPNQQVSYTGLQERLVKSVVEKPRVVLPPAPAAFVFDETPIHEVFTLLEKTYGIPIVFDAKSMAGCYVTANLTDELLTDQLTLITRITSSSYELVDGQIVFHSRGCDGN